MKRRDDEGQETIVMVRDCVLLLASEDETPYVAKVTGLWEKPRTGAMTMSLLWYYRYAFRTVLFQKLWRECAVRRMSHQVRGPPRKIPVLPSAARFPNEAAHLYSIRHQTCSC